jgi:hypothetical protein
VSKQFVGVDDADNTVPGIVMISRLNQIVYRQVASSKDDRPMTSELLALADRWLGTRGPSARGGYAVLERLHLRLDAGAGVIETGDGYRPTAQATVSALIPLGRHAALGAAIASEPREANLELDGVAALRLPFWEDRAAVELAVLGGWSVLGTTGPNVQVRTGVWVALTPTWALQIDATGGAHDLDGDTRLGAAATFGVSRMIRIR